jgi:hypothetical protein
MCAMMPMFLSCGSGVILGIYLFPAVFVLVLRLASGPTNEERGH